MTEDHRDQVPAVDRSREWAGAYLTVLSLAVAMILPVSFLAASAYDADMVEMFRDMKPGPPSVTQFYMALGSSGIQQIGYGTLILIIALFTRRRRPDGAIVSGLLLTLCMLFLFLATVSSLAVSESLMVESWQL